MESYVDEGFVRAPEPRHIRIRKRWLAVSGGFALFALGTVFLLILSATSHGSGSEMMWEVVIGLALFILSFLCLIIADYCGSEPWRMSQER